MMTKLSEKCRQQALYHANREVHFARLALKAARAEGENDLALKAAAKLEEAELAVERLSKKLKNRLFVVGITLGGIVGTLIGALFGGIVGTILGILYSALCFMYWGLLYPTQI